MSPLSKMLVKAFEPEDTLFEHVRNLCSAAVHDAKRAARELTPVSKRPVVTIKDARLHAGSDEKCLKLVERSAVKIEHYRGRWKERAELNRQKQLDNAADKVRYEACREYQRERCQRAQAAYEARDPDLCDQELDHIECRVRAAERAYVSYADKKERDEFLMLNSDGSDKVLTTAS